MLALRQLCRVASLRWYWVRRFTWGGGKRECALYQGICCFVIVVVVVVVAAAAAVVCFCFI